MLLLAHTGIPLGAVWLSQKTATQVRFNLHKLKPGSSFASNPDRCVANDSSLACLLGTFLDYRLILLGSMLPDIIDKPVGTWLLRNILSNGRVYSHTSLFAALVMVTGVYFYATRKSTSVLCLSFGIVAHLCLDEMWLIPRTFLWPLYGWNFERLDLSHWLEGMLTSLMAKPSIYIPEIIGALCLGIFFWDVIRRGKLKSFLRTGKLD